MSWWLFFAVVGMVISFFVAILVFILLIVAIMALTEAVYGGTRRETGRLRPDD